VGGGNQNTNTGISVQRHVSIFDDTGSAVTGRGGCKGGLTVTAFAERNGTGEGRRLGRNQRVTHAILSRKLAPIDCHGPYVLRAIHSIAKFRLGREIPRRFSETRL